MTTAVQRITAGGCGTHEWGEWGRWVHYSPPNLFGRMCDCLNCKARKTQFREPVEGLFDLMIERGIELPGKPVTPICP